jgi:hypothetical protein
VFSTTTAESGGKWCAVAAAAASISTAPNTPALVGRTRT